MILVAAYMRPALYILLSVYMAFSMSACTSVHPITGERASLNTDENVSPRSINNLGNRESAFIRPEWIDNPGNGVSASAATHVRGRAAQEELAILRAREEFAKRFGVNIQSIQNLSTTIANDRASTVGSQAAHEDTKQTDIKAVVKAKWLDQNSDVLWVWLVSSN